MLGPLPKFVDPLRLAGQRARVSGTISVAAMTRIAALVRDASGVVEVELRFRMSASGVPRAEGRARLTALLTCQRCLDPLDLELAYPAVHHIDLGGHGVDLDPEHRRGLVHQVDGLVGQEPAGHVTVGQHRGRHQGGILDAHPVVHLIALLESPQDSHRILH